MMKKLLALIAILLACLAPGSARGGLIGESAAPLAVKEWIKGKPVEIERGTNIYVVQIWAASSSSSFPSLTNLNHLQKVYRHKGVVAVGVSDEPSEIIKAFFKTNTITLDYSIGADDRRKTSLSYMMSVRQQGVPYAFVVGTNGVLLWHGHPLDGLDEALDRITSGRYDVDRARELDVARYQIDQYLVLARRDDLRARPSGKALLTIRTNNVELLCDLSFQIATAPGIAKRDFTLAKEAVDRAEKLAPTNTARVMITRAVLFFETGKKEEGLALAKQAVALAQNPLDKTNTRSCLKTMEMRWAASKANAGVNPTNKPAIKP
jgi:hypothetical protein